MEVDDRLGERRIVIMVMVPPDGKDLGTVECFCRFKNELIRHIAQGKQEVCLPQVEGRVRPRN